MTRVAAQSNEHNSRTPAGCLTGQRGMAETRAAARRDGSIRFSMISSSDPRPVPSQQIGASWNGFLTSTSVRAHGRRVVALSQCSGWCLRDSTCQGGMYHRYIMYLCIYVSMHVDRQDRADTGAAASAWSRASQATRAVQDDIFCLLMIPVSNVETEVALQWTVKKPRP